MFVGVNASGIRFWALPRAAHPRPTAPSAHPLAAHVLWDEVPPHRFFGTCIVASRKPSTLWLEVPPPSLTARFGTRPGKRSGQSEFKRADKRFRICAPSVVSQCNFVGRGGDRFRKSCRCLLEFVPRERRGPHDRGTKVHPDLAKPMCNNIISHIFADPFRNMSCVRGTSAVLDFTS
jgi:hypothetical protein